MNPPPPPPGPLPGLLLLTASPFVLQCPAVILVLPVGEEGSTGTSSTRSYIIMVATDMSRILPTRSITHCLRVRSGVAGVVG